MRKRSGRQRSVEGYKAITVEEQIKVAERTASQDGAT
jgi:hypothetical protein